MTAKFLLDPARRELVKESAIDQAVVDERGYESITRPTSGDQRQRERLRRLGIPSWAIKEDRYFPGILIPRSGPTGARVGYLWKPRVPVPDANGKTRKYANPKGQANRIDVHPRNVSLMPDPTIELWLNESIKKADCLTSRGICAIALNGVYGWRSTHGTLGDWEDVMLKDRDVTICYDADARTNPRVLRAMQRIGKWLKSKGARRVWYLIVPAEVNGKPVKGVDDYFAAGGSLVELKAARTIVPPNPDMTGDTYSDARLAATIADEVLEDRFVWVPGLGWLAWDERRWAAAADVEVIETTRQYVLARFEEALEELKATGQEGSSAAVDGWRSMLHAGRMRSVVNLSRGIALRKVGELDADPDLLNTPTGVVDLRTGELYPHDPALLITKITSGSYRPGFRHPDWDKALEALPQPEREWFQARAGQSITGHPTPDGILPVLHGAGENGKSALTTDGLVPALGDYASMASVKLFQAGKGTEHSTERAELRGKRLVLAEELTEGRSIDVTALKQIQDVGMITARYIRQDNFTFRASHSLFTTTNYIPVVSETDHGTWRRLALLTFPYTFRKPWEALETETDRRGDGELKPRIRDNTDHQHDAIVTWSVAGAVRSYADPTALAVTKRIADDTREWRKGADRILGFWDERIVPDRDFYVLTTDMLAAFNAWLRSNGHNAWSKELFGPRFDQHTETIRHGISTVRPSRQIEEARLSRIAGAWPKPLPIRPELYQGVRFRSAFD
jgi:P4 family phage/plasmid primase-like protien